MSITLEKPDVSVVLPAHNEERNIESVVSKAIPVLHEFAQNYEIIIVNDGSTDGTRDLLNQLTKSNPNIHQVHHDKNLGYGMALRSGFGKARYDYIFLTDGDGQFDFSELPDCYPQLVQADFIQGYRLERKDSFPRKVNTFFWNLICDLLFHTGMKDVDCAFKFFKRKILDSIELTASGAMISTELVVKTKKAGFKVVQVPVHHLPRISGKPSGANIKVIMRAFQELIQLYPELHKKEIAKKNSLND